MPFLEIALTLLVLGTVYLLIRGVRRDNALFKSETEKERFDRQKKKFQMFEYELQDIGPRFEDFLEESCRSLKPIPVIWGDLYHVPTDRKPCYQIFIEHRGVEILKPVIDLANAPYQLCIPGMYADCEGGGEAVYPIDKNSLAVAANDVFRRLKLGGPLPLPSRQIVERANPPLRLTQPAILR